MKKTVIFGSLVGGVIVFIWGMVSWMLLPWHEVHFKDFNKPEQVRECILQNAGCAGIYTLPSCRTDAVEFYKQQLIRGPIMFAAIKPHGGETFNLAKNLLVELAIAFAGAAIVTYIVCQKKKASFEYRVCIAALMGVFAGIFVSVPIWNWFHFPISFALVGFFDAIAAWSLAGLGIAAVVCHYDNKKKKRT